MLLVIHVLGVDVERKPRLTAADGRFEDSLLPLRLRNQRLTRTDFRSAADVVSWLGAVQAQDYPAAKWGLGLRARGLTDAAVDKAYNDGAILRTHVMRPTWHFVAPADIRWLLALTGPRVQARAATYYRKLGLDKDTFTRARRLLERALAGQHTTRRELVPALQRAGIDTEGQRLAHLMLYFELEGMVCSGALNGRQFTYALMDERVPPAKPLTRGEALSELTRRYFASHGPATVRDFVWWSGLTVGDANTGLAAAGSALESARVGELTYWFTPSRAAPPASPSALLLPNYDEYLIAYRDRQLARPLSRDGQPLRLDIDIFAHFMVIDGRLAGTWRRSVGRESIGLSVIPIAKLTRADKSILATAAERYSAFMKMPVSIAI